MKKTCSACGLSKNLETDFYFSHYTNKGAKVYRGICKKCYNSKAPALNLRKRSLTNIQIEDIKKLYLDHHTLQSIALIVGVSRSSVKKYIGGLHRKSLLATTDPPSPSHKKLTKNQIADIQSRYLDFEPLRSIALSCNVSMSSICKYTKDLHRTPLIKTERPKFSFAEKKKPEPKIMVDHSDYTFKLQSLVKHKHRSVA